MNEDFPYIIDRLDSQQKWHSDKSNWNKKGYYSTEVVAIAAAGLIPVINVFDIVPEPGVRTLSTLLAAIVVIAGGIGKLYRFQENWLTYRAVSETLKREKVLYEYRIGEYRTGKNRRQELLVERIEDVLAKTTDQFVSIHRAERESDQPPNEDDQT